MGAYVYYVERPGYKRYLFVLVFFVLGLMSKPMLVTLPFVLLLLDYWPLKRLQTAKSGARIAAATPQPASRAKKKQKSRQQPGKDTAQTKGTVESRALWPEIRPLLKEKIPFFVVTIVFCFVTFYAQHRVVKPMELYPLGGRIANALISYVSYIGKMLWPLKLSIFYPYVGIALFSWQAAIGRVGSNGHDLSDYSSSQAFSLSYRRVALVSGNAYSGHWIGAGGIAVYGRSLYLCAPHRHFHHDCLGRSGTSQSLALSKNCTCFCRMWRFFSSV